MSDKIDKMIELALTYGGFTSLDKVYLRQVLSGLSDLEQRQFITPPPSVINAYFAEIYQKQSPKEATDYYLNLSQALELYTDKPSFAEEKPFVRLNLSGKSYGFAYVSDKEEAEVFAEVAEPVAPQLLLEIAQVFPHYVVTEADGRIKMLPMTFSSEVAEDLTPEDSLLTKVSRLADGVVVLRGFNQEELLELAATYEGHRYYAMDGREAIVYLVADTKGGELA